MEKIKKKYITNSKKQKVAVQLDIKTYEKIEEILENYGLAQLIKKSSKDDTLTVKEAKEYYNSLITSIIGLKPI